MPVYDFTGGLGLLQSGLKNYAAGLASANDTQVKSDVINALSSGDYDGAIKGLASLGDIQDALAISGMKQKAAGDQAFTNAASGLGALPSYGSQPQQPATQPTGTSSPQGSSNPVIYSDKGALESYIRQAAQARGIDPDVAVKVAQSEGFSGYAGDKDASGNWTSFGPFQLHYAGQGNGMGQQGLGDRFTAATGLNARDPSTVKQQIDFALDTAKKEGWGAWHGWTGGSLTGISSSAVRPVPGQPQAPIQVASASPGVPTPDSPAMQAPQQPQPQPQNDRAALSALMFNSVPQGGQAPSQFQQGPIPQGGLPVPTGATTQGVPVPASPPASSAAPAIAVPGYKGTFTRAQAEAAPESDDNTPSTDEWDAAAKGQQVPRAPQASVAPQAPTQAPNAQPASAVAVPDPTLQAASKALPPQAVQSLARTAPGSQQRMMVLANMLRLAATSSNPEGNTKYVQALMDIEKQSATQIQQQTRILTPQEAKSAGLPEPVSGSVWSVDGNGKPTLVQSGKENTTFTDLITPEQRAAHGIAPTDHKLYQLDSNGQIVPPRGQEPQVAIDQRGESAEAQEIGKGKGQLVADAIKGGNGARDALGALRVMGAAIDAGGENISTGPFANQVLSAKQAVENFLGVQIPGTTASEVLSKMNSQLASASARALTNRPAQQEFLTYIKNNPGLLTSIQGNKFLISILTQDAQHKADISDIAAHSKNADEYIAARDAYEKSHPIQNPFTGRAFGAPPPATNSQQPGQSSAPPADALAQAKDAIARGAPRDAVIKRLQQSGIDPSGI